MRSFRLAIRHEHCLCLPALWKAVQRAGPVRRKESQVQELRRRGTGAGASAQPRPQPQPQPEQVVATAVAALALQTFAAAIPTFMLLAVNGLYWYRVKEHFPHGCINPAVVVSTNPLLIAVSTDLTTGSKSWPIVKILRHPRK